MTKQDRMIKAQREAEQQAGHIIEAATKRIVERTEAEKPARKPRAPKQMDPELLALAPQIKEAREQNVAWWKIAHNLSLPGSADSVAQGKAGAGMARRIYAAAYGALPPRAVSERTYRKRAEKDPAVKAIKAEKKEDRVAKAHAGTGVLPSDLSDEEVLVMLKGRNITWSVNLNDLDGKGDSYSDEEALVHPRYAKIEHHSGQRCIAFRELADSKADARTVPGAIRVVYLSRIHSIR